MSDEGPIRLDLKNVVFQRHLFALQPNQQRAVLVTLRKLSRMSWSQVYQDAGLRWEAIVAKPGPEGRRLYSLRLGRSFRAVAFRDGPWLRILSLHPDHDSAYR